MIPDVGISGFSVYVPPYRVCLKDWCEWTGAPWEKTRAVVGNSFRMRGPNESVYTMAGTAVMRLIERYGIDPARIGFLGLGTESSTDNSAGAVIVKGMLDQGLAARGLPSVNRYCEVPEVKHACLGAIYALKNALRYLALEDRDRCAIVVSADIAEYARGSTGEPTQGAGAVAMLLERAPKILSVDLKSIGSASAYRAVDFRKPIMRNLARANGSHHFQDLPVFNGKYSTTCYLDETLHALGDMLGRLGADSASYYHRLAAAFMHRPYHRMPITAFALSYLFGLANAGGSGLGELAAHCRNAGLDPDAVEAEMRSTPDVLKLLHDGNIDGDVYPLSMALLKDFRAGEVFRSLIASKMTLGAEAMKEIGNVYCAALPAWMAAGLEEAARDGRELCGRDILAVGYGSGDAAEAIPMSLVEGWQGAASRIGFSDALEPWQRLTQSSYESLHDHGLADGLDEPADGFVVDSVGSANNRAFSDEGIEYYRFVG